MWKKFTAKTTGNPGSLFVSRTGCITWVNVENIWGEVLVWKFARKWKKNRWNLPSIIINGQPKPVELTHWGQEVDPFFQFLILNFMHSTWICAFVLYDLQPQIPARRPQTGDLWFFSLVVNFFSFLSSSELDNLSRSFTFVVGGKRWAINMSYSLRFTPIMSDISFTSNAGLSLGTIGILVILRQSLCASCSSSSNLTSTLKPSLPSLFMSSLMSLIWLSTPLLCSVMSLIVHIVQCCISLK